MTNTKQTHFDNPTRRKVCQAVNLWIAEHIAKTDQVEHVICGVRNQEILLKDGMTILLTFRTRQRPWGYVRGKPVASQK